MAYALIVKLEKSTSKENDTQNLCQIQAIDANYFTVAQILNQFICRLYNSILQCVHPMHPVDLQAAVTNARDFEAAKLEANHVQAVNLVMNGLFELDSKLKQFKLLIYNTAATLLTTNISSANLSTDNTSNVLATVTTHLSATASARSQQWNSDTGYNQHPNSQNYLSLLVTSEDTQSNNPETNQHPTLTSNISPATISENKLLNTIFLFELEKLSTISLFSGAALEEKSITAMYTDAKVDGHSIKLILDNGSAGSIITKQLMDQLSCQVDHVASAWIITANRATKTPIDEIDDFSFEVNGIIIFIKVLVMEAT
ncbi:hypothetical protein G9A89_018699 [Geosiphon pyriformis]|nr:hypothetical protein G9A89_018699 [Geosiphon pyriformis]